MLKDFQIFSKPESSDCKRRVKGSKEQHTHAEKMVPGAKDG